MEVGEQLRNPASGQTVRCVEHTAEVLVLESGYEPSQSPPPPPHLHPGQEERFEVLEGAVRATVGGRARVLEQGESLTIPAGTPHTFVADGQRSGRVRWETRPALRTGELLRTNFRLAEDGKVSQRTGVPNIVQVAATLREYADEFRLVRPPRPIQLALFALLAPVARLRGIGPRYR